MSASNQTTSIAISSTDEYKKNYRLENKEKLANYHIEYYKTNKDDLLTYQLKYRTEHNEEIREKQNTKNTCTCGGRYTNTNKSRHIKSIKHQTYLATI